MADINNVILIGRLVRDLELSYTNSGYAIGNGAVAVEHFNKNKDNDVSYFDVKMIGKIAETLKPYLLKGKQISIEGYLKQDRWEQEGQKRSRVYVVAENVQLLGGNQKQNGNNGGYGNNDGYGNNGGYGNNDGYGNN